MAEKAPSIPEETQHSLEIFGEGGRAGSFLFLYIPKYAILYTHLVTQKGEAESKSQNLQSQQWAYLLKSFCGVGSRRVNVQHGPSCLPEECGTTEPKLTIFRVLCALSVYLLDHG